MEDPIPALRRPANADWLAGAFCLAASALRTCSVSWFKGYNGSMHSPTFRYTVVVASLSTPLGADKHHFCANKDS